MNYEAIEFTIEKGVALVALNRPETMNAFSGKMGEEWSDAYQRCAVDDEVRVIVVTGKGKAFCAGADMSQGSATFDSVDEGFSSCPIAPKPWEINKPVIAAVNGHAIGLGFSLAIQSDFRIFAEEGKYGLLQVRRGVFADGCVHWLLPRIVGVERAADMLLCGRKLTGQEAFDWDLCGQLLPADKVLDAAMDKARDIAVNCSPLVVGLTKRFLLQTQTMDLAATEALESKLMHYTMGRTDALEGGMAYAERREPNWESRTNRDWPDWFK